MSMTIRDGNMTTYQQKHLMYEEYLKELERTMGHPFDATAAEKWNWCEEQINGKNHKWINIFNGDNKLCGFLIIGTGEVCHPDCDYFIANIYIEPDDRGNGYMQKAVCDYINGHKGKYCMLVLKNNKEASSFWDHIFIDRLGYKPMSLRDVPGADVTEDEMSVGYEPA